MNLRRPSKWQVEMGEVRELFKRVDRVRQSGFTGFSTWESPPPSASTLSRNRLRRHRALCSMKLSHLNYKEVPFEALNHLQNIRGMCTRIRRQDYSLEQKKKGVDLVHQPPLLRRLVHTKNAQKRRYLRAPCEAGRPISASGCPQEVGKVEASRGKPMVVATNARSMKIQEHGQGQGPPNATKSCSRSVIGKHRIPTLARCHSKCCALIMCGSCNGCDHGEDQLFPSMWCPSTVTATSTLSKSRGSCYKSHPPYYTTSHHPTLTKEQHQEKPSSRLPIFGYSSQVKNSCIGIKQESLRSISPPMSPPVVKLVFDSLPPKPTLCLLDANETMASPLTDSHLKMERIGDSPLTEKPDENTIVRQDAIAAADSSNVLIKHSSNPYNDFHLSMVTMIEEEGLQECEAELEELFQYYLDLNPKGHHGVLHKVIEDIRTDYLLTGSN